MSQDWNIRSRASACAASQRPFEDGEEVVSRLVYGEEGYLREDYCRAAWTDDLHRQAISVWKSTFQIPPAQPEPKTVKKETAESLLRQLMESDDPANAPILFILAVMLERQKMFVERNVHEREDGMKTRVYEHRKTGETFLIPDPELKLDELEAVQAEVMKRLGIPPPDAEPEAADAGPAPAAPE